MKRALPLLWLAYLIVPVQGWGLFDGRPLGGLESVVLLAFAWLWWTRRSIPWAVVAVVALLLKIGLGGLLDQRGFGAFYYANATHSGRHEHSTEPFVGGFTRIDHRLSFGGPGDDDLPVHFFNDIDRFNFYLPTQPARDGLPVSVIWTGHVYSERDAVKRLYIRNPGGPATVVVGVEGFVERPASPTAWSGYVTLRPGSNLVMVRMSIPQGAPRIISVGWLVNGVEQPWDDSSILRLDATPGRIARGIWIRRVSVVFDAVLCLALVVGVVVTFAGVCRRLVAELNVRDALALAWLVVAADVVRVGWPFLGKMITLGGGDDWLSYETLARDIGLHGLWMLKGAALGQGQPFYFQPLYPYFVAAAHWVFGEGLFGVFFLQIGLAGAAAIALWRLTASLFGERVGAAGLLVAAVVIYEKVAPWSVFVLNELLFVPLVCLWALLLVRLARAQSPSLLTAAAVGVVGGVATLARSPLMLGWPLALSLLFIALRSTRRAGRVVIVLAVAMMAVTSLATFRNWMVSGKAVLVASSGPINFFIGNEPPMKLVAPPDHKAQYDRFGIDPNVQTSLEFARQKPGLFFDGWRKKALYSLGIFDVIAPERGRSVFYMTCVLLALLGCVWIAFRPAWLLRPDLATLIPLSLAASHFAILVIIFPTVHGDRLLVPFYALLVPYVAVVIAGIDTTLERFVGAWMRLPIALIFVAGCVQRMLDNKTPSAEPALVLFVVLAAVLTSVRAMTRKQAA